jgi:RNAse (barnase) inhibitor barstar
MTHYEVLACYFFWAVVFAKILYDSYQETDKERELREKRDKERKRAVLLFLWNCLKALPLLPFKIVFWSFNFIKTRINKPRKPFLD